MMKKVISIVLTLVLLLSMSVSAVAAENSFDSEVDTVSIYLNSTEKMSFANKMDAIYADALSNGEIKSGTREELDTLMEKATFATTEVEKENIRQELAQYGVYMYDSPVIAQPRSGTGDVTMATPIVFYESWEKTWTVTCGGNWKNTNWAEQILVGDVGGDEAFGVGYTNSSNTYKSSVVRASAYITDSANNKMVSTSNRSDGDGSKGFGFRLQDYIYNTSTTSEYVGYKWYGTCTYDADFGTYNGVATAYYVHTYSKAEISGVSFGIEGKTAGVSVDISSKSYSFTAYSNDKTFGVY